MGLALQRCELAQKGWNQVLLKWQVLVYSYKCIELSRGKCQKFAVLNPRPAGLNNRSNGMFGQRST